jgi:hypothetical protein
MKYTKIIQLRGVDNQEVGLYGIGDDAASDPQAAFNKAFDYASAAEASLFIDENENVNLLEIVDEELEKVGIVRIFVEEVTTDLI